MLNLHSAENNSGRTLMDRCVLVGTGGTRPLTHVRCTPGRPQRPQITSPKKTIMEHLQCWQVGRERCGGCHRAFGESNGSNQSSLKKNSKNICLPFQKFTHPLAPSSLLPQRASGPHGLTLGRKELLGLFHKRPQSLTGLGVERK